MSSDNLSVFTVRELGCKAEEGTQIFTGVELTLNEGMSYHFSSVSRPHSKQVMLSLCKAKVVAERRHFSSALPI